MVKALDQQNQGVHPHALAFINAIIVEVLAGGNAHDRIWSCHKHQMSKLDIVPAIVPDIKVLFDIVLINLRYRIIFFDIAENLFDIGPDIQIYPSLPLNIGTNIENNSLI
jgi:hypothetical protein